MQQPSCVSLFEDHKMFIFASGKRTWKCEAWRV